MYRIKFPSGEVATFESREALTTAVHNGLVTSYCFIMHERSGQWLPIVRHPHYHQALTSRATDAAAPVAAAHDPQPKRSTAAALDVPALDTLLEMVDLAPAGGATAASVVEQPVAPPPAAEPARKRGRSRELEFLYVPESRTSSDSATPPRTAGPPPRPKTTAKAAVVAPRPSAEAVAPPPAPPTPTPTAAPVPAPAPALAPTVMRQPDLVQQPDPVRQPDPVAKPTSTPHHQPALHRELEPKPALRMDDGLVDPVEAALSFDTPAPIELGRPRNARAPGGPRRLFAVAGAVVLVGGLLAWSPWNGEPGEVSAATTAPEVVTVQATAGDNGFDTDQPAEEDPMPAPNLYDVPADAPFSARTSFGGTAAQSGAAVSELPEPETAALPGRPSNLRVAVPVVGQSDSRDSLKLAELQKAIIQ